MNPKKIDIFTLPEPYPDEFLNSIIARYHCHSGNILEAKSRCELCGVPYEKKWISNVNHQTVFDTMRKYIEAHGPTIGTMTECFIKYTSFPFEARFLSTESKKKMISLYLPSEEEKDSKRKRRLLRNGITAPEASYLRYCPDCVREDIEKYREPYWHRIHQLRIMQCCPVHKRVLLETNPPCWTMSRQYPQYADDISCSESSPYADAMSLMIARNANLLLTHPFSFDSDEQVTNGIRVCLIAACIHKGYCLNEVTRFTGKWVSKIIYADLLRTFGESFLFINDILGESTLHRILHDNFSTETTSTASILLFMTYFGIPAKTFLDNGLMKKRYHQAKQLCEVPDSERLLFSNLPNELGLPLELVPRFITCFRNMEKSNL